ncbi:co-chaperone protein daf-41-like isoform X1 [Amphibalanus amphitrite]|uniref:co-chaperone protein daf-41-like isoform X1 n=2 Tax=Amphibalanus amphitrite TaxID=1232801 RepID=UPI001C8FA702|nr:co-chaperone protein daf-41-like isoform X1 [Amphibalanus amphitrite]XP_043229605.1 co-chaperone protein daf-41-like isoform X1 [Amphibalanus amphitrite]
MSNAGVMHPSISWAQRSNLIFLTINVEDVTKPEIKVEENRLYFKGTGGSDKKTYEADLELYGSVNAEDSKQQISDRNIQLVLMKKTEGPYWPRLLKDSAKVHWLKVDFGKWKDEDDSDDDENAGSDMNLEAMMKQMGGLGGGGAGDGSKPNMDDLSESDDESDEEKLPDLEE